MSAPNAPAARPLARWLHHLLVLLGLVGSGLLATSVMAAPPVITALAAQDDTLRWMVVNIPPYFSYPEGHPPRRPEDLGEGELAGIMRLLIARLPQYHHEFVEAGLPRLEALARGGQTLCTVFLVPTPERHQWLYFTPLYPSMASRQLHVVVASDRLSKFKVEGQTLQLSDLLQRRDMIGLLPAGRAYGPRIDRLLSAQGASAPQMVNAGRTNLLGMLRMHRMDYTLEYPSVVENYLERIGTHDLALLPIAEGLSTPVAPAACSRTPQGLNQIEAIDRAMRQLAQDPQREAWVKAWLGKQMPDAADQTRLMQYLDERGRGTARVE